MVSSPTPHGNRSLFLAIFLLLTNILTVTARPLNLNLPGITATAGSVTDSAPLYLAPFPNENSTDPNIIPDEYIIALFPDSSYAALDAFMTETYGAPLDADRVDVLVRPGDPPRFDSYLWAHGVSAGWVREVRTFPGTKRVSRNGYATAGASEPF